MIHWLPQPAGSTRRGCGGQRVERGCARAGSDDELALLDAVVAVTKDLSGQADAAVDQVVRRVSAA